MRKRVIVVGAGVYGLACALALLRQGREVVVLDRAGPGGGASGNPVGALAPMSPYPWSARRALQRDWLRAAPAFWRGVAEASGLDPGLAQVGRLIPLASEVERRRAVAHLSAGAEHWGQGSWELLSPRRAGRWFAPAASAAGALRDRVTLRLSPPKAVASLAAAVEAAGGQLKRAEVVGVEPGCVVLADGSREAGVVVLAAGATTPALFPRLGLTGIKGQAALLAGPTPTDAPLVSAPGIWIVPHADGSVGVGSTTEPAWEGEGPDTLLDAVVARARDVCPWLAGSVIARWAGARPRAAGPEPLVGWVADGLLVATGGYKTSFASAPAVADLVAALVAGEVARVPKGYAAPTLAAKM